MTNIGTLLNQFNSSVHLMQANVPTVLRILALLYCINIVNCGMGYALNICGIYPRNIFTLPGIIVSPLLHGSFAHIFANTIPFFVLANLLLLYGIDTFINVSIAITVITGALVWLLARRGFHVGMSGLIMGYWSYLLVIAYYQDGFLSFALAGVCLYYFAGLIINIFPSTEKRASWEAHLFGFAAGIIVAFNNTAIYSLIANTMAYGKNLLKMLST